MGDIQVTLLIGFFMLISYIWAKIPYGMTAVFCCLALEITGVLSSAEAWAGFGNTTVFLFAIIVAYATVASATIADKYTARGNIKP